MQNASSERPPVDPAGVPVEIPALVRITAKFRPAAALRVAIVAAHGDA